MAKLGTYSYPDIRFSDAVEISARIRNKFRGVVTVKGLAWELGMAENSGTLFAKVAALRDFGLVEGRGELRVSELALRILHPAGPEEGKQSSIEAFQRVDLLRALHERFQGEAPDDTSLLVGLEEISKAPRDEIVRRFTLIQKHLVDAARVMKRTAPTSGSETSGPEQQTFGRTASSQSALQPEMPGGPNELYLAAGGARLKAPLTLEFVDVAINLLRAARLGLEEAAKAESDVTQP